MSFELNYDECIHLDAENLAETGIARAYSELLPHLRKYIRNPAPIEEIIDDEAPSYSVVFGNRKFTIYTPDSGYEGWGLATFAFFAIVNSQFEGLDTRFYAINGGNDLVGMFLTHEQALESRKSLPNKRDWPYLPTDEDPWYGHPH